MEINVGEVWWVEFPYEDTDDIKTRPAMVLDVDTLEVLSVKVTKHKPREDWDMIIIHWDECNLTCQSTARVRQTILLPKTSFKRKIGTLHNEDLENIMIKYAEYLAENNLVKTPKS